VRHKKIPAAESFIFEDSAPAGMNYRPDPSFLDLDEGHFREASDWPSHGEAIRLSGGFSVVWKRGMG
jgi:hypothetical protein